MTFNFTRLYPYRRGLFVAIFATVVFCLYCGGTSYLSRSHFVTPELICSFGDDFQGFASQQIEYRNNGSAVADNGEPLKSGIPLASLRGLSGPFNDEQLKLLQQFPNLEFVSFVIKEPSYERAAASHTGFSKVCHLPRLRNLVVGNSHFGDQDLDLLVYARNLERLDLSWSEVESLDRLPYLPSLKELRLAPIFTSDRDLRNLVKLPNLETLALLLGCDADQLAECSRDGSLQYLRELHKLRSLRICVGRISPQALQNLAEMKQLQSLAISTGWLTDNAIDDVILAMGDLRELLICEAWFSEKAVSRLSRLQNLRRLSLETVFIKRSNSEHFIKDLLSTPNLRSLRLRTCHIEDADLKSLPITPFLEELELTQNDISDEGIEAICHSFPRLKKLWIDCNDRITDDGVRKAAGIQALELMVADRIHEVGLQGDVQRANFVWEWR